MSERRRALEVGADELTARCDPASLPFGDTAELHAVEAVYGQERAVRAIEFALGMRAHGYHLYASGPDGIGKASIVEAFLRRRAAALPPPPDRVYVHNFADPDRPSAIALAAGEGREFAATAARAVAQAAEELQRAFDADSYLRRRADAAREFERRRAARLDELQEQAAELGFALQMTPAGIVSAPIVDGQPANEEALAALPAERREEIRERARERLEPLTRDALLALRAIEREARERLERLDDEVAEFAVRPAFEPLRERWGGSAEALRFLDAVSGDMREQRGRLRAEPPGGPAAPDPSGAQRQREALLRRYEVNVLIGNDPGGGAPVVSERNPGYGNLLGRVEYETQAGAASTDHMLIRPGSLARASGGYLMLRMRDLLRHPAAYEGLKRALHSGELAVENLSQALGVAPVAGLRPEPMPIDAKVVIVGDPALYSFLYRLDPDFRELFRVKADFEVDVERNAENVLGLCSVIHSQCARRGLRCFTDEAAARLVEHASRRVEDQRRLSGNIGEMLDIVRQADYWAGQEGAELVARRHVERALEEREYRSSLVRDRLQQLIDDGTILIDTAGAKVGQINALSVYDLGDLAFGRPSRITCVTSAGRGAVVHVEREADMAGRTHRKGFLILRGFLADRFGQDRAMALHASLTFEQIYGDIDGDSASSTELYALLSSLSETPIDQAIAVTGSLNQRGEVQPIGGATAKIEGFWEACRARGLDGSQGVMIPRANVHRVVLRPEVAASIARGEFHVWAVATVEEGVEVLTGVPAGARGEDGRYPPGTVFGRAQERLERFAEALRDGPAAGAEAVAVAVGRAPAAPAPAVPPGPPPDPPIEVAPPP